MLFANRLFFSRVDAYFGDQRLFNQAIFEETMSWWTDEVVDRYMLANSRLARQIASRRDNPTYHFPKIADAFSIGEVSSLVLAFGDRANITTPKHLIKYWFGRSSSLIAHPGYG